MKRRLLIFACALALLLGLHAFAAGGGTAADPLISLNYLMGTFFPQLEGTIARRAEDGTAVLYNDALDRVDAMGNAHLAGAGPAGWAYSPSYEPLQVKRGDQLLLYTGSGVLWLTGRATAGAGLVDVTTAEEPAAGAELAGSHRYLNGVETPVSVTVLSDAATLAVEGYWVLTESGESVTPFTDLTQSSDWFYGAARFAYDRALFTGTSETLFSPGVTMNRAMLATVLYRMTGSPGVEHTGVFPDVPGGAWYSAPMEWAAAAGVVRGYEDDTARPFTEVNRETIAVMLYRYAGEFLGYDVSARGDLSAFPDGGSVSGWAVDAVQWAVGTGIIGGSNGEIKPHDNATRAEVATMLQRLILWAGL